MKMSWIYGSIVTALLLSAAVVCLDVFVVYNLKLAICAVITMSIIAMSF